MTQYRDPALRVQRGVFLVGILLLPASTAATTQAQSLLSGEVLALDSSALSAAHVTLHDAAGRLKAEMLTDSAGGFSFRIANHQKPVTLYLGVVRIGYVAIESVPVRVDRRERVTIRVMMSPDAVQLAPVTVVARQRVWSASLDDYYDRLEYVRRGVGRVLDRDVMRTYAGFELLIALQRVPGLQYGNATLAGGINLRVPRMRGGCIPMTFLDRMPIEPDALAALDPASLQGVLVYVGETQIPPDISQLAPGATCGVIMAYSAAPARRTHLIPWWKVAAAVAGFTTIVLWSR